MAKFISYNSWTVSSAIPNPLCIAFPVPDCLSQTGESDYFLLEKKKYGIGKVSLKHENKSSKKI